MMKRGEKIERNKKDGEDINEENPILEKERKNIPWQVLVVSCGLLGLVSGQGGGSGIGLSLSLYKEGPTSFAVGLVICVVLPTPMCVTVDVWFWNSTSPYHIISQGLLLLLLPREGPNLLSPMLSMETNESERMKSQVVDAFERTGLVYMYNDQME